MKKTLRLILIALACYVLLLVALLAAEAQSADASIQTFGDAVWFSLITMTTVGYGDLSPVTPLGRILGLVFAFCSLGVLTLVIGLGINALNSQLIPRLRLRSLRKKQWHCFSDTSQNAIILAELLRNADSIIIFFGEDVPADALQGKDIFHVTFPPDTLSLLKGSREGIAFYCMGEDGWTNYLQGVSIAEKHLETYSLTDADPSDSPKALHAFRMTDCLSRSYWKEYPVLGDENKVVLIGLGDAGTAILERALLTNVFQAGRTMQYHVFADDTALDSFSGKHPIITEKLSRGLPGEDCLTLHRESWQQARDLIASCDRIILCADTDEENLSALTELNRWYVCPPAIHVRLGYPLPGITAFGSREQVLTPEHVIRKQSDYLAHCMNDIYNASNPDYATQWDDLSEFLRQSNIAAADHVIIKLRYLTKDDSLREVTPSACTAAYAAYQAAYDTSFAIMEEMEHRRWMRFHELYNWQFSPVRNNSLRQHHLLVPFSELSVEEQKKDDYAWEMIERLASIH